MVFPTFLNLSLNLVIRSSWSEPQSAPGLVFVRFGGDHLFVKVAQLCPTIWDPMDYIVHGILQARILEWVAFPFSRGFSQPRDRTQVSCIAGRFFSCWATAAHKEMQEYWTIIGDSLASSFAYLFSTSPGTTQRPFLFPTPPPYLLLLPLSLLSFFPFCPFLGERMHFHWDGNFMQVRAMYWDPNMLVIF